MFWTICKKAKAKLSGITCYSEKLSQIGSELQILQLLSYRNQSTHIRSGFCTDRLSADFLTIATEQEKEEPGLTKPRLS
jgi:hypothetical protein